MTIDKSKLTELLVNKTGLEEKQVEEQLSLLILRIQQAAQQGKDFQIEGFGTFSIKDDALHFEPSRGLETEINHKYAGMKPIELVGAFKDMPPAEEETSSTGTEAEVDVPADVADADTSTGSEAADDINIDTPVQTDAVQKRQRSIEEILGIGQSPAEPEEPKIPTPPVPVAQQDEQKEEAETDPFVFDREPKADTDDPFDFDDDESIFGSTDEPEEPAEKDEKDPIGTVLIVCVILLVIGVAAWSVYELDLLGFSENGASSSVQQAQVESPVQATSEQQEEPAEEEAGPSPAQEIPEELNEPEPEEQGTERIPAGDSENENNIPDNSSVYGLTGSVNAEGNNGYTIVVHSLKDRNVAQRQQSQLVSEGYRVILTEAIVNGETFWRVSLGQFETLSDTRNAIDLLPEPYKSNNFIKRIQ